MSPTSVWFYATVAAKSVARSIMFSDPGPILVDMISQEGLEGIFQIWHKRPLGLKEELIRIWWSNVKVSVYSEDTS